MIKMQNGVTGDEFYIHESRLEEYLARGHKMAPPPPLPVKAPAPKRGRSTKK